MITTHLSILLRQGNRRDPSLERQESQVREQVTLSVWEGTKIFLVAEEHRLSNLNCMIVPRTGEPFVAFKKTNLLRKATRRGVVLFPHYNFSLDLFCPLFTHRISTTKSCQDMLTLCKDSNFRGDGSESSEVWVTRVQMHAYHG